MRALTVLSLSLALWGVAILAIIGAIHLLS